MKDLAKQTAYWNKLVLLITLACALAWPAHAWGQGPEPVVATWKVQPPAGGWTVGDPIQLQLRVMHPSDITVTLPELPAQWGPFEVREQKLLQPSSGDSGLINTTREIVMVAWAPGDYSTPPLDISYQRPGEDARLAAIQPISITVASVLSQDDVEKHDLKPQASLPRPPLWPWVLASLAVAALTFIAGRQLWRRWKNRQQAEQAPAAAVDSRPAEQIAYEALDHIAALDLPAQGEFKQHYTLVTDCVRAYLERIYPISATDRTSGELIADLRRIQTAGPAIVPLRSLLDEADLVKFAKFRPTIEPARAAVVQARHIVDITKPAPIQPDENPSQQEL